MAIVIRKLKIHNFKKFKDLEICFNDEFNVLIGDNESGKTTILQAIDLCLSGSMFKVESLGIHELFNLEALEQFFSGSRDYNELPILSIEITLSDFNNFDYEGKKNSYNQILYGVKLLIIPNDEYSEEIKKVLNQEIVHFPIEFYKIEFRTYADNLYNMYNRKIKHLFVDNSTIDTDNSMKEFTLNLYRSYADSRIRQQHLSEYNNIKSQFEEKTLSNFNKDKEYSFGLHKTQKYSLENNLTIYDKKISIWHKGKGEQTLIKTSLAIQKKNEDIHILLLEEPENHLSSNNMLKMIERVKSINNKQLILTTHNNLILSRLNLSNAIFVGQERTTNFDAVSTGTVNFFNKQTNSNLLQFVLSNRVVLVEGPSEYILLDYFYFFIHNKHPHEDGVSIISVNGLSFLRYLEIASKQDIIVAVITDNDKDYKKNIEDKYKDYLTNTKIEIFSDKANENYTFEICLFKNNKELLEKSNLTKSGDIISFMTNNKSESALRVLNLLMEKKCEITVPSYIESAIRWIKE